MADTKQLFEILVKQIKLDQLLESNDSFADGKLNKLEVHKNSKRWTFYFEFKDVLPFKEFRRISAKTFADGKTTISFFSTKKPGTCDLKLAICREANGTNCKMPSATIAARLSPIFPATGASKIALKLFDKSIVFASIVLPRETIEL